MRMMQLAPEPSMLGDGKSRTRLFDLSVARVEDVRSTPPPGRVDGDDFSPEFQLALPYRGFFVWHVGRDEVVGDANQALYVTGGEQYRISHPLPGGYRELIVTPSESVLAELAPGARGDLRMHALFRRRSRRVDPRLQGFRAQFLSWASGTDAVDALAAEELVVALLWAALDDHAPIRRPARCTQRLLQRAKAFLESELAQPIRLEDVGRAVGASPVYLTQLFRLVEGVGLHQYLTQLRLARALAELPDTDDLTRLSLDLGFSSHSHFSARFRRAFGVTPSQFRRRLRRRPAPCSEDVAGRVAASGSATG
jgi:AraC family transcriptional regulator